MQTGLAFFPTEYAIPPAELAVSAEERGFESLWFSEHSHIPAARTSPWPGGDTLPDMYYDVMDPFVALAAAAAVTTRIRLATGICLIIQRDPIQTAKAVASLDRVSGGRVLFGIGAGWNAEEMANHGTAFDRRFKVMRERVEAMKAIWTEDEASYDGEFVRFERIIARPKPVQKPGPPIHVGGGFPGAAKRAIRYGDGFIPILGRAGADAASLVPEVRKLAEEAGRDPSEIEISSFGAPTEEAGLEHMAEAGVARAVFFVPSADRDTVLPLLDRYAKLSSPIR
ncbi:MAG: LLM class F420-dependent oxidoreductase [Myxococcota bacterium]|nr:LLM class F420-dependent oxidoreductase [Myxococcota bacterium]